MSLSSHPAVASPTAARLQPILTITTSKNWVLPPRPKNAAKAKAKKKVARPPSPKAKLPKPRPKHEQQQQPQQQQQQPQQPQQQHLQHHQHLLLPADLPELPADLHSSIRAVDRENYHLKTTLLSLIHDYKSLRALVLSSGASGSSLPAPGMFESPTTARKRLFTEIGDPMSELISDMNELSYKSPSAELAKSPVAYTSPADLHSDAYPESYPDTFADPYPVPEIAAAPEAPGRDPETTLFDFVNLDNDSAPGSVVGGAGAADDGHEVEEIADEEVDDELDSASLSLSLSASVSEADENMLMTSLTRSTTVSTNNLFLEKRPSSLKFYDLPVYSEDDYAFLFEKIDPHSKMMSVIQEDHYNQVADFLEEKLMSNDLQYYVDRNQSHPTVLL